MKLINNHTKIHEKIEKLILEISSCKDIIVIIKWQLIIK